MYFATRAVNSMTGTFLSAAQLIILLLTLQSYAQTQTQSLSTVPSTSVITNQKPYTPTGRMTFLVFSRQVEDDLARTNQAITVIQPEILVKYGNNVSLGLDLQGIFGTGNASNFWNDDGKPPNQIALMEAFAKLNFDKNVFIKAGAVKTPINPIMSIMTPTAFVGAQEEIQIGSDDSNITLTAYQGIPSTGTVSRRVYDDGTQAYYLSQVVAGKLKTATRTEVKAAVARFQFENLSTNVATDSYYLGNSLNAFEGIGKGFRFRHGFVGTEATMTLKQELGPHDIFLFGSAIENEQAQPGKNKGRLAGLSSRMVFGNFGVKPGYMVFDYGADVIPNAYTTLIARYQNRVGYRVTLDLEMVKEKLILKSTYVKMDLKDDNPYLADREVYNVAVEAKYDIF